MKFAKLFDYEDGSQILIKKDTDDKDEPEVRIFFEPEGLGVCSNAFGFPDSDEGYEARDHRFDIMDKEKTKQFIDELKIKLGI